MILRLLALSFLVLLLAACSIEDPEKEARTARAQAVERIDFWRSTLARPLNQRIKIAPQGLLDYVALANQTNHISNVPRPSSPTVDFIADVRAALDELPADIKALLENELVGIYFIDNVGGSALTHEILDAQGRPVAGVIILDPFVLSSQTANSWATWKENTPFKPDPRFRLSMQIADPASDDRKNAIAYNLLHEIAHVLSIRRRMHPPFNKSPKEIGPASAWPFMALSWQVTGERYAGRFDEAFSNRTNVVYYGTPLLPAGKMAEVYQQLGASNFSTLYAATNPFDDFAESFVNYVHVTRMRKPWLVRIYEDEKLILTHGACWEEARCAEKRKLIESLLARPS